MARIMFGSRCDLRTDEIFDERTNLDMKITRRRIWNEKRAFAAIALVSLIAAFAMLSPVPIYAQVAKDLSEVYPLDRCPVSGNDLSVMKEPIEKFYGDRQVRFCTRKCPEKFEEDLLESLQKLDGTIITQQKPRYPLDTCVVSGKTLDGPGVEAVDFVYKNRLVRFCCEACIDQFKQDPAPFLDKLDTALIKSQEEHYPLDRCVVSGDTLPVPGHEQIGAIIGYRLLRVCGEHCFSRVLRNPSRYFAILENVREGKLSVEGFVGAHTREFQEQQSSDSP